VPDGAPTPSDLRGAGCLLTVQVGDYARVPEPRRRPHEAVDAMRNREWLAESSPPQSIERVTFLLLSREAPQYGRAFGEKPDSTRIAA